MGPWQPGVVLVWDHNAYYHQLLLEAVPAGAARVLEVGCGAGALAVRLSGRAGLVDAVDRDATMVDLARARVPGNVTVTHADVLRDPLPGDAYDAIVSMSVLHHLPLAPVLARLSSALRPGGVLAAVALPRTDLPRELPVELAATAWHLGVGAVLRLTGQRWPANLAQRAPDNAAPTRDPELTVREVRTTAAAVLPGVRVRRLLLWRYLMTWRADPSTRSG